MGILDNLQGTTSQADVMFAAMVHHHHAQGIEMARMAEQGATSDAVREQAAKMAAEQTAELEQLTELLGEFGAKPMPSPEPVEDFMSLSMEQMDAATGTEFDRMFLRAMSFHHVDAVHQAELFIEVSKDNRVRQLAEATRAKQLEDLQKMRGLLAGLS